MPETNRNQGSNETPRPRRKAILLYSSIFVVAPVFTFLVGRTLDILLGLPRWPPFPYNIPLGFGIFLTGLYIGIQSTRELYSTGRGLPWGELSRRGQSIRLVTTGPYAYTRNPMTLGYSLLPCGMGLVFQSLGMATFIPTLVLSTMIIWLKLREEPNLQRRFKVAYTAYKESTPFLVPVSRSTTSRLSKAPGQLPGSVAAVSRDHLSGLEPIANLSLSVFGLGILVALLLGGRVTATSFPYQGQVLDALFSMVCVLGIIAASSPSRCNLLAHARLVPQGSNRPVGDKPLSTTSKGHHPDCGRFSSHTFRSNGRTYCAGCTGMMAGAMVSLVGAQPFLFGGWRFGASVSIVLSAGSVFVVLGLLQGFLHYKSASVHFSANVVLAIGSSMVLVAGYQLSENFFVGLYALVLIAYLVFTRIAVSSAKHRSICRREPLTICNACAQACV